MVLRRLLASMALLALVGGCSSTKSAGDAKTGQAVAAAALPAPQFDAVSSAQAEYRIGPLDLLEISVFQVPELSKTVNVGANGEVALPLIGNVTAGGRTVAEVEAEITSKLAASYLQSPQVSVFVKESTSQRVTVDGAVEKPGVVPLTGQTTLLQTVAMAGGLSDGADAKGILVFRNVQNKRMAAKFDLVAIRKGTAEDPVLYGGDVVVVDRSAIRSAFSDLKNSLPLASFALPLL